MTCVGQNLMNLMYIRSIPAFLALMAEIAFKSMAVGNFALQAKLWHLWMNVSTLWPLQGVVVPSIDRSRLLVLVDLGRSRKVYLEPRRSLPSKGFPYVLERDGVKMWGDLDKTLYGGYLPVKPKEIEVAPLVMEAKAAYSSGSLDVGSRHLIVERQTRLRGVFAVEKDYCENLDDLQVMIRNSLDYAVNAPSSTRVSSHKGNMVLYVPMLNLEKNVLPYFFVFEFQKNGSIALTTALTKKMVWTNTCSAEEFLGVA